MEHLTTSGFRDVDSTGSTGYYVGYLDAARRKPQWVAWKAETLAALELAPGERFLDVGCGTGEEVTAAAAAVSPGGAAVGVDYSSAMAREASSRARGAGARLASYLVGDALRLPFASASFDGCRVERTMTHVPDAGLAVREIARVVRPGGRVVLFEPDYGTLVYGTPHEDTTRRLLDHDRHVNPSRTVGRHLPRWAAAAGLAVDSVAGRVICLTSYEEAVASLRFDVSLDAAQAAGQLSPAEAGSWTASLRAADAAGGFVAMMTMVLVVARKPG